MDRCWLEDAPGEGEVIHLSESHGAPAASAAERLTEREGATNVPRDEAEGLAIPQQGRQCVGNHLMVVVERADDDQCRALDCVLKARGGSLDRREPGYNPRVLQAAALMDIRHCFRPDVMHLHSESAEAKVAGHLGAADTGSHDCHDQLGLRSHLSLLLSTFRHPRRITAPLPLRNETGNRGARRRVDQPSAIIGLSRG